MRGRPVKSEIRQNIVELLMFMNKGTGYNIYKAYKEIYPQVTMRSIYYHLKKGLITQEFKVEKIANEEGNYSWGTSAEKIYYSLGENATPKGLARVEEYFNKK